MLRRASCQIVSPSLVPGTFFGGGDFLWGEGKNQILLWACNIWWWWAAKTVTFSPQKHPAPFSVSFTFLFLKRISSCPGGRCRGRESAMLFSSANWKNWSTAPIDSFVHFIWMLTEQNTSPQIPLDCLEDKHIFVSFCWMAPPVDCNVCFASRADTLGRAGYAADSFCVQPDSKCKSNATPPLSYKIHNNNRNINFNWYNPPKEPR